MPPTGSDKLFRAERADKRVGTCKIALMPLGTPAGIVSPEAVTNWAKVAEGALIGTRQCTGLRRSGGAMIITGE